jgi:release factor glutamine methyltransferase
VTAHSLLADATARLRAAGIENPRLEARLLWEDAQTVGHRKKPFDPPLEGGSKFAQQISGRGRASACGDSPSPNSLPRSRTESNSTLPRGEGEETKIFEQLLARRIAREPLAYITGTKEYWSLEFDVGPGVLIPRPETELMVESALQAFADKQAPLTAIDLGTGSGAILIAFLREFPNARGLGIDASGEALQWARRNARKHGVESRCEFRIGNWAQGIADRFDLVFANPPYVDAGDMARLAPEVGRFEPHLALSGGADGLDAYRTLANQIDRLLAPGGWAFVEVGMGQAEAVSRLFQGQGLEIGGVRPDLSGIQRCLALRAGRRKVLE